MRNSLYTGALVLLLAPGMGHAQAVRRLFKDPSGVPVAVGSVYQGGAAYVARLAGGTWVAEELPLKLVQPEATVTAIGYGADGARYVVFEEMYKKRKRGGMLLHSGGAWQRLPEWKPFWIQSWSVAAVAPDKVYLSMYTTTAPHYMELMRWDGKAYQPVALPAGATLSYAPLILEPTGSVVLAARTAAGATVYRLVGEAWVAVGAELKADNPSCLVRAANGDLWLSDSEGALYHWNGTAWSTPGGTPEGLFAKELATAPDNSVFVAFGNNDREVLAHITSGGVRYMAGKKDGQAAASWEQTGAMVCDADGTVHVVARSKLPVPYGADRFLPAVEEAPAVVWTPRHTTPAAPPVPKEYPAKDEQAIAVSERYAQLFPELTARQVELRGWMERCMVTGGPSRAFTFEYQRYLDIEFQPDLDRMRTQMASGIGPMRNRLVDRFNEMLDNTMGMGNWLARSMELNGSNDTDAMAEAADNMAAAIRRLNARLAEEQAVLDAYMVRNAGAEK
jgi:hypothetical protein